MEDLSGVVYLTSISKEMVKNRNKKNSKSPSCNYKRWRQHMGKPPVGDALQTSNIDSNRSLRGRTCYFKFFCHRSRFPRCLSDAPPTFFVSGKHQIVEWEKLDKSEIFDRISVGALRKRRASRKPIDTGNRSSADWIMTTVLFAISYHRGIR